MAPLELALPPAELIDLVLEHQGTVTREELLHRYSQSAIEGWLQEQVLVPQGERFTLGQLTAYVDGLVLAQWAVPEGIIGKVSALVFHELSVELPRVIDMSLPPDWQGMLPADLGIRPFVVAPALREYGVMIMYPTPPGSEPVRMYTPAVALAQVWADPAIPEETREDALMMYRAFIDEEAGARALQDAFRCYGVSLTDAVQIA